MIPLALRTFADRWQLFVGTVLAVTAGVAIVHAGMTIILGVENAVPPDGSTPAEAEAFQQAASGASTLTGMTVMLGAFLTIFVVGSTFNFAVDQRRGDLAILRLGGVTSRQVRRLLLAEALLTAVIGAAVGGLLGVALTGVQSRILASLGTFPEELATPIRPAILVLDLVVAGVVCLAGAWGGARRATAISPLDALRRTHDTQRVMTVRRWIVAAVAVALTAVQTYFSATTGGMLIPLLLGLGIVITASVAMSRLSPLLVPAVALVLMPWARRSPVADLAVANLRDAIRRTASCAAPMIVLVSLVMGLQGILDTQTEASATEATQLLDADLVAQGEDLDLEAVDAIDGIALAAPETVVPLAIRLTSGGMTTNGPGTVVAVDPAAFGATHLQRPDSGDVAEFGPDGVVFGPGLDSTMIRGHYDEIVLDVDGETVSLREAARMGETLAGSDGFYIDRAILPPEVLDRATTVLVQLEPGADAGVVGQRLAEAGATNVLTPAELSAEEDSVSARENRAVMAAIVGLGSVYALISVLSTLAIAIGQRRVELATLRLTGLTRRQVQRTTVVEALAATGIGLLLGAVAAVLALVGLWAATQRVYGTPVIAIPWTLLGAITVLTTVLTVATAMLATRGAMRIPPVQALGTRE
ncbi:FtsX-like permease family protein [Aeromicrobium sp. YIM 150415]|uniref:FtsX-like permease family protein n=1 Tax=Aeromicrobium sp. YIM 150415 TaxID=2803912 RepID=UPI001964575B|nr:FtsX-like permease family protein [Aeromicrobium sp. YIM 150415]MBM9464611.1 FtsX-like permease family protein [Aeromicrobium sp. YIM 150415]